MKPPTLVAILVLFAMPATAQISLDPSLLEGLVGQQVSLSLYPMNSSDYSLLTPLLNATGPGQTYDFTPFSYSFPSAFSYEVLSSAAGTPGENDAELGGANWVQLQNIGGTSYVYYDLRDEGFFLLGSIFVQATDTDGNGILDQSIQKNMPPDPTYIFPLTGGSAWNETIVSTTEGFGSTSQTTSTVDFLVEGWGTLVTPVGSAPALRLRKTLTVEGAGGYTTTSHIFVTDQLLGASIILDSQGTVLSAAYNASGGDPGPTGVEEIPQRSFRLEQNYPNPFTSTTRIVFELERPGQVMLNVFDLMGREVGRLVNAQLPVGSYTTDFLADRLPSGVYFYQLQVDGITTIRQLVLQK